MAPGSRCTAAGGISSDYRSTAFQVSEPDTPPLHAAFHRFTSKGTLHRDLLIALIKRPFLKERSRTGRWLTVFAQNLVRIE